MTGPDAQEQKTAYLGDGVYASFDGWHIWLKLDHYDRGIALEPDVLFRLNAFSDACHVQASLASRPRTSSSIPTRDDRSRARSATSGTMNSPTTSASVSVTNPADSRASTPPSEETPLCDRCGEPMILDALGEMWMCACLGFDPVVSSSAPSGEPYVQSDTLDPALREELREWQTASAHAFHRFEDALPENQPAPSGATLPDLDDFSARLDACSGIPNALRLESYTRGFGDLLDGVLRDAKRLCADLSRLRNSVHVNVHLLDEVYVRTRFEDDATEIARLQSALSTERERADRAGARNHMAVAFIAHTWCDEHGNPSASMPDGVSELADLLLGLETDVTRRSPRCPYCGSTRHTLRDCFTSGVKQFRDAYMQSTPPETPDHAE